MSPAPLANVEDFAPLLDRLEDTPVTLTERLVWVVSAMRENQVDLPEHLLRTWRAIMANLEEQAEMARDLGDTSVSERQGLKQMSFVEVLATRDTASIATWGVVAGDAVRFSRGQMRELVGLTSGS